jgi:type IV pilus assembly protein PilC
MNGNNGTLSGGRKLNNEELSIFSLKLSMMIKSGINAEKSVEILLEDAVTSEDSELLSMIHKSISEGHSLSRSLQNTNRFPHHMVQMIEIGQITGRLGTVLNSLYEFYRREASVSKIIKNAMTYPAIMLTVTSVILFVLVSQVLPVFEEVFRNMGAEINATVSFLLTIGAFSKTAAIALSCVFLILVIIAYFLSLSQGGKAIISRIIDSVFFGKKLDDAVSRSRFSSAMSLMLSSGLNVTESLERTKELIGNGNFSERILLCNEKIENGVTFPKATEESGVFTKMQSGLLSAGFRSGLTEQAMREVADICENDSDSLILNMINKIEPSLIVVLALSVGLVLLSVMLPLIGMMSAIGV